MSSVYQKLRCTFTAASIEPEQSQAKQRPASSFRSKGFVHRVDVVCPDHWSTALELLVQRTSAHYYRATATLSQIFEKDFLRYYVKTGNISMLSEGNPTSGNSFALSGGKLRMYLDRETYERSGLPGKIDERNGSREMRPKWFVAYDLQSPSMQHGKRGFDRLVYGCKTISDTPMNWIFTLEDSSDEPKTFDQFSYTAVVPIPKISRLIKTHQVVTSAMPNFEDDWMESSGAAVELYEWISLVRLESPRVLYSDFIDPYISRYSIPDCSSGETSVRHISWDGLFSSSWVSELACALIMACPEESWFTISATDMTTSGLGGKSETTVLKPPGQSSRYFMWDIKHN